MSQTLTQHRSPLAARPATALKTAASLGLLGGVIAILVALQGMLQAFATRDIVSHVVSMGQILLLITFLGSAYMAVRRLGPASPKWVVMSGALAGLIAGVLPVLLVALGGVVNLGSVFISATPPMYDLLTFQRGAVAGSLELVLLGGVMGIAAAALHLLSPKVRGPLVNALVGVIAVGLLQELIRVLFSASPVTTAITNFLYETSGLSIVGAIVLGVLIALISYLRSSQGGRLQGRMARLSPTGRRTLRWSGIAILGVFLLILPNLLGLLTEVVDTVGIFLLMGLGLNIVVGFAGLLDLGYVAFYAIGAYTVGILTSPELQTGIIHNWWLALPFAVLAAVAAGVTLGIPVLKMRGDYLAIVTLGFGEIIRILAGSNFLQPYIGGAQGIQGIPKPNVGPLQITWLPQHYYYIILAGCLLAAFVATRLKGSRMGRAWMAIREDEDVAEATGIHLVATKLMAFAMGASFGGLSGAILASKIGSTYPHGFQFIVSVNVLALIIIGGMGSIPGVIVGALVLVGLPELLREVGDYRYLFYGAALVIMMLTRPEGLVPEAARRRELHEDAGENVEPPPLADSSAIAS